MCRTAIQRQHADLCTRYTRTSPVTNAAATSMYELKASTHASKPVGDEWCECVIRKQPQKEAGILWIQTRTRRHTNTQTHAHTHTFSHTLLTSSHTLLTHSRSLSLTRTHTHTHTHTLTRTHSLLMSHAPAHCGCNGDICNAVFLRQHKLLLQ